MPERELRRSLQTVVVIVRPVVCVAHFSQAVGANAADDMVLVQMRVRLLRHALRRDTNVFRAEALTVLSSLRLLNEGAALERETRRLFYPAGLDRGTERHPPPLLGLLIIVVRRPKDATYVLLLGFHLQVYLALALIMNVGTVMTVAAHL